MGHVVGGGARVMVVLTLQPSDPLIIGCMKDLVKLRYAKHLVLKMLKYG